MFHRTNPVIYCSSRFFLNKIFLKTSFPLVFCFFFIPIIFYGCVAGRGVSSPRRVAHINEGVSPGTVYSGLASYYGDEFAGRTTASGEIYTPYALTAAHPFLAMGTRIKVTHLKNKKSINVRINDRMPYNPDRIIDLSKGAAKELGMLKDGLAEVRIEILGTD